MKQKSKEVNSIRDLVCKNTGMTEELLLNDTRDYHIDNLERAAKMIFDAINADKTIYIAGDYDADGICSSAIMYLAIKELDGKVIVRLPKRMSEGYGMSVKMVDEFDAGQFILTVDNGITAFDAIRAAKEKGMTVLVTDHHLPAVSDTGDIMLPEADLIIDPNALPETADFSGYCGSGIAYKLAKYMLGEEHPLMPKFLSFAALATVADSVPLIYENRRLVKEGLKSLLTTEGTTSGIRALLSQMGVDTHIDADTIGFKIAPALNAAGRVEDDGADISFKLLTFDGSEEDAEFMASQQIAYNELRKKLCSEASEKTEKIISENHMENDFPLILYVPDIHEGIVGIVAGQISEKYNTPCILFTDSGKPGVIKGSGRANGLCNLKEMLDACSELLLTFGGHSQAAGVSMDPDRLEDFRKASIAFLKPQEANRINDSEFLYDIAISENEADATMREVSKYAPYGEGNPAPVVCVENVRLLPMYSKYYKLISGDRGVKFTTAHFDAVSFNGADKYMTMGCPKVIRAAGHFGVNEFRGKMSNQLEILDMEPGNIQKEQTAASPFAQMLAGRAAGRNTKG